jgi:hypothetical protein
MNRLRKCVNGEYFVLACLIMGIVLSGCQSNAITPSGLAASSAQGTTPFALSLTPPPETPPPAEASHEQERDLVDPSIPLAVAGQDGYEYQEAASVDLDGDGDKENVFLIANAVVVDGVPWWDDGHTWQAYVEEATGERTYLFAQFVQLGRVDALIAHDETSQASQIVLILHAPGLWRVYEIDYRGVADVQAQTLIERTLSTREGEGFSLKTSE